MATQHELTAQAEPVAHEDVVTSYPRAVARMKARSSAVGV
jgi:hypothetical protein